MRKKLSEILLKNVLPKNERISHIGSTAIPSIWAKPIIDILVEVPVASKYETMKLKIWKEYEHNRDGYTNAKTEFVKKYTSQAKAIYGNRY